METGPRNALRILLVEDNPGDVRLVRKMLSDVGDFSISSAGRLRDAIGRLSRDIDVVLLDLNLSDSIGLETLNKLKAANHHVPIIVMTSIDDEQMAVKAVREGAADYLVKGQVDGRLLRRTMLYSIERNRLQEELAAANRELEKRVAARTVEVKLAEQEMRALSNRLLEILEEERRAIANELHDQVGQYLTMIKLLIERAAKAPPEKVGPLLREASQQVTDVVREVRKISLELRPSMLDDLGLEPTLTWLVERIGSQSGLNIKFEREGLTNFPPQVNTVAYRIIQESLANIVQHGCATKAKISARVKDDSLDISIEDNGRGFDVLTLGGRRSTGLSGMRERARALGGEFKIESAPGVGTRITVKLPLNASVPR